MISIIIPTYNEKDNIVNLIKEIRLRLKKADIINEVIIVDDDSTDGTGETISKNFDKDKSIRLFVRKNSKELGSAILFGIRKVRGSVIIGMDADFNHPPSAIVELIKQLKDYHLVVASRYVGSGGMHDRFKFITSYIFNWSLKSLLNFPIMDNTSGFYAIKKNDLFKLPLDYIYKGYGEYHIKLVYLACKNNLRIKEIPVYFPKRVFGLSKSNTFKMFFSYLWTALNLRINRNK